MFRGIRIFEKMTRICSEQGDNAIFTIAEWIEDLQEKNEKLTLSEADLSERNGENYEKYIASSIENCDLRREVESYQRQVKRLLAKIKRLESVGFIDED